MSIIPNVKLSDEVNSRVCEHIIMNFEPFFEDESKTNQYISVRLSFYCVLCEKIQSYTLKIKNNDNDKSLNNLQASIIKTEQRSLKIQAFIEYLINDSTKTNFSLQQKYKELFGEQ